MLTMEEGMGRGGTLGGRWAGDDARMHDDIDVHPRARPPAGAVNMRPMPYSGMC